MTEAARPFAFVSLSEYTARVAKTTAAAAVTAGALALSTHPFADRVPSADGVGPAVQIERIGIPNGGTALADHHLVTQLQRDYAAVEDSHRFTYLKHLSD